MRRAAHLWRGQHGRVRLREGRPREARRREGGQIHQFKVAIKPAKPLSFAAVMTPEGRAVPVFGLPGNPVSSMVSYQVVALPALRKLAGHRSPLPRRLPAVAVEDFERRPDGKLHCYVSSPRMGPDGRIVVRSAGGQASHQLAAMAAANALALVPDGAGVAAGGEVQILLTGLAGGGLEVGMRGMSIEGTAEHALTA